MLDTKRLFIGLELPEEPKQTLTALDPHLRGLRWLPPEQIHLTLSFLGDVEHARSEQLREALHSVHVSPFFLPLVGLGTFKSRGRPSVLWADTGKGHPHLFALHKRIQDALLRLGFEADLRPFHPHVTIARARDLSSSALQPLLRQHSESEFGLVRISSFTLYSSELLPEGAVHRVEAQFPL